MSIQHSSVLVNLPDSLNDKQVLALLGILKGGRAIVPLSTRSLERVEEMLPAQLRFVNRMLFDANIPSLCWDRWVQIAYAKINQDKAESEAKKADPCYAGENDEVADWSENHVS